MIEDKFHWRVSNVVDRLIFHKYMNFRNYWNVIDRLMFHNCMKSRNKWQCEWASYVSWLWISLSSKLWDDHSRFDQKTCSLKQTSIFLIWINEDPMPSTAFSTSFRKLKRRVGISQDISVTDNLNSNFSTDNYSPWKNKQIDLLFIKGSKFVLNYRALKFQYIFNTFSSFSKISQKPL